MSMRTICSFFNFVFGNLTCSPNLVAISHVAADIQEVAIIIHDPPATCTLFRIVFDTQVIPANLTGICSKAN